MTVASALPSLRHTAAARGGVPGGPGIVNRPAGTKIKSGTLQSRGVSARGLSILRLDRFAFVKPTKAGHFMRMLQPEELKMAMGWSRKYKIKHGTRRNKVKMIGNAVCPPVMKSIIINLTSDPELRRC